MEYFKNDSEVESFLKEPFIDLTFKNRIDKVEVYGHMIFENNDKAKKILIKLLKNLN